MNYPTTYRTLKVDGLSIFYREAGPEDAPPLLLLHGLPSSSRMFEPLFTRLSDRYHLIAPDYPGFGHSDWPDPKKFAYTFDNYAEIMNHFTEALGLSRYALYMHVGPDPDMERHDPDLWTDEFYFLNQPGQAEIQSDLFYDYRTNVESYPKWQAWMREKQPRLLVIWGKYESSFDPSEPESYRKDVPNAEVHIVDGGHFALDTAADEIAALVRSFMASSHK
jgi:pimeloyl-ACP methyl ester carboxylesterase